MGIYLNPRNDVFKRIISSEIYVDKTLMLGVLNDIINTQNNYVCLSRPRRFGKTIANNMISSYYSKGCDSRELFAKCKIAGEKSFEANLNRFNVINIDVNSEYRNTLDRENLIQVLTDTIKKEFREQFPKIEFPDGDSVGNCILKIFNQTGEQFVILLDEYDVLVREEVPEKLFVSYLDFLNGLFKSNTLRSAIALAYITGILPVIRDRVQSKLNNFDEYTILNAGRLSEFTGFTTDEVRELCERYKIDFDECKNWYDGYKMLWYENGEKKSCEVYNPESVVKTMYSHKFGNYWNRTSTYAVISDRIAHNFDGTQDDVVRMIAGESVDVNVTTYKNTMDSFVTKSDVYTYLLHLGYLAYNEEDETCRIPNNEVRKEWLNVAETDKDFCVTDRIVKSSKILLSEVLKGNAELVASSLDESHIHVTSNRSYNNEDALQSAIYLSFIYALNKYTCVKEMTAGKGFADVVYIPLKADLPAMIVELKRNGSAESAVSQIREKKYFESLSHYTGDLLFIGINYDEKTKKHECKIERFVKE